MRISPPELVPFNRQRYLSDITYRIECDYENQAERAIRIALIFGSYRSNRHGFPLP